jgi:hypothetical protein
MRSFNAAPVPAPASASVHASCPSVSCRKLLLLEPKFAALHPGRVDCHLAIIPLEQNMYEIINLKDDAQKPWRQRSTAIWTFF